jgi:hypothetical protein
MKKHLRGLLKGVVSARPGQFLMLVLPLALVLFGSSTAMAHNDCFTLLSSGAGPTLMTVCISQHGNLSKFESPAGFDQIGLGNLWRDGYSICTGNLPDFPNVPEGYDAGANEAGFGAAVIVQPNGPNTLPLTITRTTTDGVYELKQSYAQDTTKRDIVITMKITRRSNADCGANGCPPVRLARYFEGDVDNNQSANARFAQDTDSVWEWINVPGNHGFVLDNLQSAGSGYATTVHTAADFDPNGSGFQTAKGCIVFAGQVTTPTDPSVTNAADLHGRVIYIWGNIALNKSKTVKVSYRRF